MVNFYMLTLFCSGWGDWSRTGAPARTPNLDAMSRSPHTVWFQRAYSGNPICSPTVSVYIVLVYFISGEAWSFRAPFTWIMNCPQRASLQTGRTPARSCIWGVEQHILCRAGAGGCGGSEYSLANATRDAGKIGNQYLSGFYGNVCAITHEFLLVEIRPQQCADNIIMIFIENNCTFELSGKWHLGSLSDRGVDSPDCYPKPPHASCQLGYWERDGGCCFGLVGMAGRAPPHICRT